MKDDYTTNSQYRDLYIFSLECWESVLFELRSERVFKHATRIIRRWSWKEQEAQRIACVAGSAGLATCDTRSPIDEVLKCEPCWLQIP